MFVRELEERMKIIASNTRCRIFSVSYNPRYYYPYRMAKCDKVWGGIRDSAYELMLDSAYKQTGLTNETVIEKSKNFNPDYIFPKDYPGNAERTLSSLQEFLTLYKERNDIHAKPIPIIQAPHVKHYREYQDFYSQFSHFALGGLQKFDPLEQVRIIRDFRDEVGDYAYIHGFGIGTTLPLIKAMRTYSPFLDSLDVSTAEQAVKNGDMIGASLEQSKVGFPRGVDATTVNAQFSNSILLMLNYMLSDNVNSRKLDELYNEKLGFSDINEAIQDLEITSRHDIDFGVDASDIQMDSPTSTTLSQWSK